MRSNDVDKIEKVARERPELINQGNCSNLCRLNIITPRSARPEDRDARRSRWGRKTRARDLPRAQVAHR